MNQNIYDQFLERYFEFYKLIEEEFCSTFKYVEPSIDNLNTYSNSYLKILISACNEILIILQFLIKLYEPQNTKDCFGITLDLLKYEPDLKNLIVQFKDLKIMPWDTQGKKEPDWWTAYNNIKHHRLGLTDNKLNYKFANLENVLNSLAALHTLEMYAYRKLALDSGDKLFVPLYKSIFSIVNSHWENMHSNIGSYYDEETGYLLSNNL